MTFWDWFVLMGIYTATWVVFAAAFNVAMTLWLERRRDRPLPVLSSVGDPLFDIEAFPPLSDLPSAVVGEAGLRWCRAAASWSWGPLRGCRCLVSDKVGTNRRVGIPPAGIQAQRDGSSSR